MEGVAHSTARSLCRAISREGALYIETEHANKCCVFEEPWRLKFMLEILLFSQVYSSRARNFGRHENKSRVSAPRGVGPPLENESKTLREDEPFQGTSLTRFYQAPKGPSGDSSSPLPNCVISKASDIDLLVHRVA